MISLLIVNYRSSTLAIDAIRTAREASRRPLQIIVADNSCDPREVDALRPHADVVIASASNRGYAGGINDGRKECRGDAIVITNPDVTFAAGSIDALVDALDSAAVAGPALFWDEQHRWLLPPAELHTTLGKADEVLASRSAAYARSRDRRRFFNRVAFWSLTQTTRVRALSGAVMAIRRDAPEFDERFALYFEETDFLRRVDGPIVYVPAARVRHYYNQSAGQESLESAARYAQSELKYLEKWSGPFAARMLKSIERPPALHHYDEIDRPIEMNRGDVVIEASPLPNFATAAGCLDPTATELPPDVVASWKGGPIYLRAVERATGQTIRAWARRIPA